MPLTGASANRTVFLMREIEGLGTNETAECLGLTAETVKVRLHRARSRLRYAIYERVGTDIEAAFPFHAPRCDRVVAAVLDAIESLPRWMDCEREVGGST